MTSKAAYWVGVALTVLSVLFLLMDGGMKAMGAQVSIDATAEFGFDAATTRTLGIILVAATILYAVPLTSLLGAVIITGYLGGAIAIQLRQGNPLGSHVLFGVYVGLMVWAGLWLRSPYLRSLFPLAQRAAGHP